MRTKSGQEVIAQRKRNGLKILYFLKRDADVEKRFDMVEIVTDVARSSFASKFNLNLAEVLE